MIVERAVKNSRGKCVGGAEIQSEWTSDLAVKDARNSNSNNHNSNMYLIAVA